MPQLKVTAVMVAMAISLMSPMTMAQTEDIPAVPVSVMKKARQEANAQMVDPELGAVRPTERNKVKANANNANTKEKDERLSETKKPAKKPFYVNRQRDVLVQPGVNTTIAIALNQPNRLLTPFKDPQVISSVLTMGKGNDGGEITIRDNVVYVTTDRQYPVTIFITEYGREDIAMSLTMVPERVPPKEVKLTLPESIMAELRTGKDARYQEGNVREAKAWETGQPYEDMIRETFRSMALGQVPQGYTLRKLRDNEPAPLCRQNGLVFSFKGGQILEGSEMDYYVGVIRNATNEPIEFLEQRCGGWRVAAVTAFPLKVLKAGEATEVYVAVKHQEEKDLGTVRRPLVLRTFE